MFCHGCILKFLCKSLFLKSLCYSTERIGPGLIVFAVINGCGLALLEPRRRRQGPDEPEEQKIWPEHWPLIFTFEYPCLCSTEERERSIQHTCEHCVMGLLCPLMCSNGSQVPGGMSGRHLRPPVCTSLRLSKRGQMLSHQRGMFVRYGIQRASLPGQILSARSLRTHLWQILPL